MDNVIYAYTRAQAIADGVLVDVSKLAREAGFKIPVAVTAGVWAECVAVPEGCHLSGRDGPALGHADDARYAIAKSPDGEPVDFAVHVRNDNRGRNAASRLALCPLRAGGRGRAGGDRDACRTRTEPTRPGEEARPLIRAEGMDRRTTDDEIERARREAASVINTTPKGRPELETTYGQVWDTERA